MNEFLHILTSWPHWAFEVISDLALALPAFFLGRLGLRRHDRREHGYAHEEPVQDREWWPWSDEEARTWEADVRVVR